MGTAQGRVGGLILSQPDSAPTGMPKLGHTRFVNFPQWFSVFPEITALPEGEPVGSGLEFSAKNCYTDILKAAPRPGPPRQGPPLPGGA